LDMPKLAFNSIFQNLRLSNFDNTARPKRNAECGGLAQKPCFQTPNGRPLSSNIFPLLIRKLFHAVVGGSTRPEGADGWSDLKVQGRGTGWVRGHMRS
jgi:hypothetical protein